MTFPHKLLTNAQTLASFEGWTEDVYLDFLQIQQGKMTEAEFDQKYRHERAVMIMDMTGLTSSAMHHGELQSLLRIVEAQNQDDQLFSFYRAIQIS